MNLKYGIFFSIELMHEYFLNQKCTTLELSPTEDCREISRSLNIQWRTSENRLLAMIKENDDGEPFINIPPHKSFRQYYSKKVFRFYLRMKDPTFLNYTNFDLASLSPKKIQYFSNISRNKEGGKLYLSLPVKEYALNKTYLPGNFVKDPASGNIFEAVKKNTLKKKTQLNDHSLWIAKGLLHLAKPVEDHTLGRMYSPGDFAKKPGSEEVFEAVTKHAASNESQLNDPALWLPREHGVLQYPTENDALEFTGSNYRFIMPSAISKAEISVSAFNFDSAKPDYDVVAGQPETRKFEQPASTVNIDLSGLQPGKYHIKVNKENRIIYYDPAINSASVFGVVEIFNHLPGTDDFSLLTDDEKLKFTKYYLQFANRRVLWKYVRKDGKAESITDTGDTGYVFNLEGDNFISAIPLPLSENVCKTLKLEFNTKDFRLFPLPNPPVKRLGRYNQNDFDYLCSEVYLNY